MSAGMHTQKLAPTLDSVGQDQRTWSSCLVVVAMLLALTVSGYAYGGLAGPHISGFLAVTATIWTVAELLTAFLLLSQFQFSGNLGIAIIAAGYGISGLLTIPYLLFFPGVVSDAPQNPGLLQVSVCLWLAYHLLFPAAITVAHLLDRSLDTLNVPQHRVGRALRTTAAVTVSTVAVLTGAIYLMRDRLPVLVVAHGGFTPIFTQFVAPALVATNAAALGILLIRARKPTTLQTWLGIALLTMLLDSLLNSWSPGRYSIAWYVGKVEALITATVVCLMLLKEVAGMYRRLHRFASLDDLTGLRNRRGFRQRTARAFGPRAERNSGIALLIVDIDFFKQYNDRYGHSAGDSVIAAVASSLATTVLRAEDSVARYGGDEFVILLPGVLLGESEAVAERVRRRVAELNIVHEGAPQKSLTVSIGIGYCEDDDDVCEASLFEAADEALYRAKREGRDRGSCVVLPKTGGISWIATDVERDDPGFDSLTASTRSAASLA
jgi:diguanylate cyclase (GGDEF)-like protein